MLKLPRLFAKAKTGKIKYWEVEVRQHRTGSAELCIRHAAGLDDSPIERVEVFLTGKNIGKVNETTPYEQAFNEAQSRWKKQRDKGYSKSVETCSEANSNTLGLPMPMLAYPIEKYKQELPKQCWVQPKLNGHRCLAHKRDGEVILYSRQGKRIDTMPHIEAALQNLVRDGETWDGELYIHGERLQDIGSLVKRRQPGSERVEYHVYDCVMDAPFEARRERLVNTLYWVMLDDESGPIWLVPTDYVNYEELSDTFKWRRSEGYEGLMVRHTDKPYEVGFRSWSLLKVKGFEDAEFIVKDIIQGTPVRKPDGRVLEVPVLVCDGFKVTAPGTEDEKHAIWINRESYIGRPVTVKYYELTKDGVPFHPVALQFREDI